ncbi:MAG: CPBP family intramembrane metalloprotease [Phycisphaerae bacterium]|nr:CPBP family intramembrane metalloprotease [Phycisphaerae bacterium]
MASAKKNKRKTSTGQLVNFVPDSYLDRTSRPVYAIAFLLIFIVVYEIGTLLISPDVLNASISHARVRVVSFIWLRNTLEYIGFSPRFVWIATPLAVVCILLALQLTSGTRWRVYLRDFGPMTVECILLSAPLIVLSLALNRSTTGSAAAENWNASPHAPIVACAASHPEPQTPDAFPLAQTPAQAPHSGHQLGANIITGIGAGIYEEFIFRLLMIILLMIVLQDLLGMPKMTAITISVLISAVLFSLHHHIFFINGSLQTGDPFTATRFFFRFLAGVYFAVLFAVRGFGVAAGTHAWYDIVAALLNALFYHGQ